MIKGLIFDLDGTLLNTINDIGQSVNEMLEDYGYKTHSMDEYRLMVGHGFKDLIYKALPSGTSEQKQLEGLEKFLYYYNLNYLNSSHPYEGIKELLENLQTNGFLLGVNSNKREDYTISLLDVYLKEISFKKVVGQKDQPKKPDPLGARQIMEAMGLKEDEVVYVGDSKTDILTAKNANMTSIGVLWGFRGEKELVTSGADYLAAKPSDILDIIKRG